MPDVAERSFLSDIMRRVALGRWRDSGSDADVVDLCHELLGEKGEASGLVLAQQILDRFEALNSEEKQQAFLRIGREFGVQSDLLQDAIAKWKPGDVATTRSLHFAAEPGSQELIRRLNRMPGATSRLVSLRAALLEIARDTPELRDLDRDFQHLFSSWFNRGFLEIRRINWTTPADILEKIIKYEAVHEINGWEDLRQRVGDPDRRLFAFFHPAMPSEPLIFVEVALTQDIPGAIAPILDKDRSRIRPDEARVAVFYSISNCQKGLRGISFGNFLIKQVVAELQLELPDLTRFVTLSPVPGLRRWAEDACASENSLLDEQTCSALQSLTAEELPDAAFVARLAARYLTRAKRSKGTAYDPVAHFHLGNGAILHKIHAEADLSQRGIGNSWGVMVNYLYDGTHIEARHQAYAAQNEIAATSEVLKLAAD